MVNPFREINDKKTLDTLRVKNSPHKNLIFWTINHLDKFKNWKPYELLLLIECSTDVLKEIQIIYKKR